MIEDWGIYLVTDTAQCDATGLGVPETVRKAVAAGARAVQIRAKNTDGGPLLALVEAVADAVGQRATLLIDDRVDVYLAARQRGIAVHGVHVGQNDLPATEVRALVGPDAIVGLTANNATQVAAADALPSGTVDYLGVGSIHATATKPDHPDVLGVTGFGKLAASTRLPCVAIGGITLADVAALRSAGGAGVAVVSAICASNDPAATTHKLVQAWEGSDT